MTTRKDNMEKTELKNNEFNFINHSGYEFIDISNERVREYHFVNKILRIDEPMFLYISESGGQRIVSKRGRCLYVPSGFLWIEWRTYDNKPHMKY